MNTLYYGDNLDILRRYIKDESVDLIYLDPPFNSARDYNVLFKEQDGKRSAAQIKAFSDTWQWDQEAARSYQEVVENGEETAIHMLLFQQTHLPRYCAATVTEVQVLPAAPDVLSGVETYASVHEP